MNKKMLLYPFFATFLLFQIAEVSGSSTVSRGEIVLSEITPCIEEDTDFASGKKCSVVRDLDREVAEKRMPAAVISITYESSDCKVGIFGHVALMLKDLDGSYTMTHQALYDAPELNPLNKAIRLNEKCLRDLLKKDPDSAEILKGTIADLKKQKENLIRKNPSWATKRRVLEESTYKVGHFEKTMKVEIYKTIKSLSLTTDQMLAVKARISGIQRKLNGNPATDNDRDLRIHEFNNGNCLEFIEFVLTPDIFRAVSSSKIPYFEEAYLEDDIGIFGKCADSCLSCFSC